MRKSRFTEYRMLEILRAADEAPVAGVAKSKVSSSRPGPCGAGATVAWGSEEKPPRRLQQEHAPLKQGLAERDLEFEGGIRARRVVEVPTRPVRDAVRSGIEERTTG